MVVDFSKSGFVYFIQQGEKKIFKIGSTQHSPLKRLSKLQTGSSEKLYLIGFFHSLDMKYAEKNVHRLFWQSRLEGEWFEGDIEQIPIWLEDEKINGCTWSRENNLTHYVTLLGMKLWHFKEKVQGELELETNFIHRLSTSLSLYLTVYDKDETFLNSIQVGFIASDRRNTIDAAALSLVKRLLHDFSRYDVHYKTGENSKSSCFFFERNAQDREDILTFDSLSSEKKIELIDRNSLYLPD
jgi:hypothetical protein